MEQGKDLVDKGGQAFSSGRDLISDPKALLRGVVYALVEKGEERLKTWLLERGQWMDEHIESLRQYCHPSRFANQMLG